MTNKDMECIETDTFCSRHWCETNHNALEKLLQSSREQLIGEVDKKLTELLNEYANTQLSKRGNGWDWILKARDLLHLLANE